MQKTAYGMRISDWSSDVFSSDLVLALDRKREERRALVALRLEDRPEQERFPDHGHAGFSRCGLEPHCGRVRICAGAFKPDLHRRHAASSICAARHPVPGANVTAVPIPEIGRAWFLVRVCQYGCLPRVTSHIQKKNKQINTKA